MARFYTLLAILIGSLAYASVAQAQSFTVTLHDEYLDSEPYPLNDPYGSAKITNTGTAPIRLIVVRTVEQLPAGMQSYFCFSVGCYAPFTNISSDTLLMVPGAVDSSFKAYVTPNGTLGTARVRYSFRDLATNTSVEAVFQLNSSPVAVGEFNTLQALVQSAIPANGTLRLAPAPGLTVRLQDITGRTVRTATLTAIPTELNIRTLTPGTYILSTTDGRQARIAIQ
jgi:hypothetical protein